MSDFVSRLYFPTPMRSRKKRPADLDLLPNVVVAVKARHPDDSAGAPVNHNQCPARLELVEEEAPKLLLLVPIGRWMLLPDQSVAGDRIQFREVRFAQWPQLDQVTQKMRLPVEHRH